MGNGRTNDTDVAVVGGGLAGLTAAACLARGGRRVTLFEGGHLGGRAATQERNGFQFNLGPHAVYKAGPLRRILEQLGVTIGGHAPAGPGVGLRGGKRHLLPRDPGSLLTTSLFGLGARVEAAAVFASLPRLNPQELARVTVGEWLDRLRHPEVRQFAAALIRLNTFSGDERQCMGTAAAQVQLGLAGVLYLDGGWASMVTQLDRLAREAGAEVHTGSPVVAVEHDGAVRGVRLQDSSFHPAGAVVLAVSPQVAARLTGSGTALHRWATEAIPVRIASLDVGLRRLPHPEAPFALGIEEPHYFSVHSLSARLTPEGGGLIHAARYLKADEEPSPALEAELEGLLDEMQPGWRDELVERRFLRHVTVANLLPTAEMGGTAGRPGPAVPGVENLYIAGDWVGPEGLLSDASAASAEMAANMILARAVAAPTRDHALAGSL